MYQLLIFIGVVVTLGIVFIIIEEKQEKNKTSQCEIVRYLNYMVLEDGTILYPSREEVNPKGQQIDIIIK